MIAEDTQIDIITTENSRISQVDFDNIPFGRVFSDHMFEMDYIDGKWTNLKITPYGPISIPPSMSALHYGQAIFEGMKAFKNDDGRFCLFRPEDNAWRLNQSAKRLSMPEVPEKIFMDALVTLINMDRDWIPNKRYTSLYIRPFMFATDQYVGVKSSETYKFIIFTCPVGMYYSKELNVKVEREFSRACPGGIGQTKAAGNYAGSLYPARLAQEQGFDQLIWTDSSTHSYVEESGTMNVGFIIDDKFYTPPTTGTILKGITRHSSVQLLRSWGMEVTEDRIAIDTIEQALKSGKLTEAFGMGTAATIAKIKSISVDGKKYELPNVENGYGSRLKEAFEDIRRGKIEDEFNWIHWLN